MSLLQLHKQTIPDWNLSTIGEAAEICNNLRYPISREERQLIAGKYRYYGPTGILDYINEYRIEGSHVLIGEDGDHFLKSQKKSMTLLVDGQYNVNNHAHVFKGKKQCLTEWLFYFYMHADLSPFITRQGVGRFKLTKDALIKLPILLPPLPEQRKIAEILGTWDRAIDTQQQLINSLTRRKKALMQQLLTGKTRLPGFEGEWKTYKLGDLFKQRKETKCGDLPLLSITASQGVINRDQLAKKDSSNADKSKYQRIAPGDIGYNTMRMWQGVSALSSLEGIVSPAYTICTPNEKITGEFAAHFFKLPHTISLFHRYSQGLVADTLNLKYPNFSVIEISIPPTTEEQTAIARILLTCDKELALLHKQRKTIDNQKRGLMQQLLTGKIRTNE